MITTIITLYLRTIHSIFSTEFRCVLSDNEPLIAKVHTFVNSPHHYFTKAWNVREHLLQIGACFLSLCALYRSQAFQITKRRFLVRCNLQANVGTQYVPLLGQITLSSNIVGIYTGISKFNVDILILVFPSGDGLCKWNAAIPIPHIVNIRTNKEATSEPTTHRTTALREKKNSIQALHPTSQHLTYKRPRLLTGRGLCPAVDHNRLLIVKILVKQFKSIVLFY